MTDTPPIIPPPVAASLPNAKIRFLNPDGTVSLPWWRYFQAIFNRTGGSTDTNEQVLQRLAAAVAQAQETANQAEEDAQSAIEAAELGAILGPATLGGDERDENNDSVVICIGEDFSSDRSDALSVLGLSALDQGLGTVTSVGLSAPPEFTVSGSPVTNSGTLTLTKVNQSESLVYAGPASGAPAQPGFRGLVANDIPDVLNAGTSIVDNTGATPTLPVSTIFSVVGKNSSAARFTFDAFSQAGNMLFRSASGTGSSPSALSSGQTIGQITAFGFGTSAYSSTSSAAILFNTTQNWSNSAMGTSVSLFTTPNNTTAARQALLVDQDGGAKAQFFIQTKVYTVATLPSATGLAGSRASVSDATAITFGAITLGGGTMTAPVYCDGANWRTG